MGTTSGTSPRTTTRTIAGTTGTTVKTVERAAPRRGVFRRAVGLTALSAALSAAAVSLAAAADASPVPPKADSALLGVWINTDPSTRSVPQVDITPNDNGSVSVDAFGQCSPSLCEWGSVPAIVYGTDVSAASGATFQTNQSFLSDKIEWARTTLFGSVRRTESGLRLTLRELTVFEDGSGRKNYTVTETFTPGRGASPTRSGNSVPDYRRGAPPLLAAHALGHWVNPAPSGSLVAVDITNTAAAPVVHPFGQCSPSPCDLGTSRATTYGPSISASRGRTALAPYDFGFKKAQLVVTYRPRVDKVVVTIYNEFTDGSGRSNYVRTETFVRS